jgi:predicted membrane channel-forming protein YqfA (hemolysin III family)
MTEPGTITRGRGFVATVAALVFLAAWVAAVVTLADHLPRNQALQAAYFVVMGSLWVLPVRWLMLWAAHHR